MSGSNINFRLNGMLIACFTEETASQYSDVIMSVMASQITIVSIGYSTICWGGDQRKHQSYASLAVVRGIHRSPGIRRTKGQLRGKNVSIWWRHHVFFRNERIIIFPKTSIITFIIKDIDVQKIWCMTQVNEDGNDCSRMCSMMEWCSQLITYGTQTNAKLQPRSSVWYNWLKINLQ